MAEASLTPPAPWLQGWARGEAPAAGLHSKARPSLGGDRPVDDPSDLDGQTPRRSWRNVSRALHRDRRNPP
ncbi:hypothetical protein HispidOSU_021275, partial [Sigmodon hispidus]